MKLGIIACLLLTPCVSYASAISDIMRSKAENDLSAALHQAREDFPKGVVSMEDVKEYKKWGRQLYGAGMKIGEEGGVSCLKARSEIKNISSSEVLKKAIADYKGSAEDKALLAADLDAVYSALADHLAAGCMSKRM